MLQLRDYQQNLVNRIRESYLRGRRSVLAVAPTGAGKTAMFTYMTERARAAGRRVLILVHRQELLTQASRSLSNYGVSHGLIAPGQFGEREQVAVASIQTLDRRLKRGALNFDFLILDEAHHAGAATWARVLAQFPNAHVLGVTATPCRLDGQGLGVKAGGYFEELIEGPTVAELTERGFLMPATVYIPPTPLDLKGVRKRGGDFDPKELAERTNKPTVTGCAVDHYSRLSPGEPAIAFCASIEHATSVRDSFRAAGYSSEVIHGGLRDRERKAMIDGLASGRIHVLTSVDLISEGTDIPVVAVAIMLRGTASVGMYLQMVGRVLRPNHGKRRAIILDHVGNVLRHGLHDDKREWSLDGVKRTKQSDDDDAPSVKQCKACYAVYERGLKCPYCGHLNVGEARRPREREGDLKEVDREELARLRTRKRQEVGQAKTREELQRIASARGYSPYWVDKMLAVRGER